MQYITYIWQYIIHIWRYCVDREYRSFQRALKYARALDRHYAALPPEESEAYYKTLEYVRAEQEKVLEQLRNAESTRT